MQVSSARTHYDVIIVGCGPVGALLALLCGGAGLRVCVVEAGGASPVAAPRAVACDDEVVRLCGGASASLARWLDAHVLACPVDIRAAPPGARGGGDFASLLGPAPPTAVVASGGYADTAFFF